ncbi:MAG: glycosyltransferase family 2 protein [Deltaproteobacteria bacterium]|nr:glycosyltransferase family 2 protein [Deltaproteobacteria bacterium]
MPRVSIVIVNFNGGALLRECAASVAAQTYRDVETIVVDNGSTDDSVAAARGALGDATLVRLETNTGFASGNNLGIARASGELIVTLNNDARLTPTCLAELVAAADRHPDAGMFAPKVLVSTDPTRIDSAGLLLYVDGVHRARGWQELDGVRFAHEDEVLFPCASVALYRRSMFDDVGLFDEEYFLYLEDGDLGMRGRLRGWACWYVPRAVALHLKSSTAGKHSKVKAYYVERNRIFNLLKHTPLPLIALSPLATLYRYALQAFAALTGRGASGGFVRDYSHGELLRILLRSYVGALRALPAMWRKRRAIYGRRLLSRREIYALFIRYRLPARDLAFKD